MDGNDSATHLDLPALAQKQQARLHEFLAAALEEPDPLRASLGATTSDLIELAGRVKQRIDGPLASGQPFFDDPAKLAALNSYLRLTKQVQAFAQLGLQLADGKRRSPRRSASESPGGAGEEIGV